MAQYDQWHADAPLRMVCMYQAGIEERQLRGEDERGREAGYHDGWEVKAFI